MKLILLCVFVLITTILQGDSHMKKVLILGDSNTTGYPFSTKESWTKNLSSIENASFTVVAYNGYTLNSLLPFANIEFANKKFDTVFLMIGLNEGFSPITTEETFTEDLTNLKKLCDANGSKLILSLPINYRSDTEEEFKVHLAKIKNAMKQFASKHSISLFDCNILSDDELVDQCHPNKNGYNKMSVALSKFIGNNI